MNASDRISQLILQHENLLASFIGAKRHKSKEEIIESLTLSEMCGEIEEDGFSEGQWPTMEDLYQRTQEHLEMLCVGKLRVEFDDFRDIQQVRFWGPFGRESPEFGLG